MPYWHIKEICVIDGKNNIEVKNISILIEESPIFPEKK